MIPKRFALLGVLILACLSAPLALGLDAVGVAEQQIGKDYGFGAETNGPNQFDCSGLTWYAFGSVGIEIGLTATEQSNMQQGQLLTRPTSSQLQRGDLLFFDTEKTATGVVNHVGIYEGGGQFVQAVSGSKDKKVTSSFLTGNAVYSPPTIVATWQERLLSARRLPNHAGTPSTKFSIGDAVLVNQDNVTVRDLRAGAPLGQRSQGDQGMVVFGPVIESVNGSSYWWWQVDFESGADGWVAEDFLNKTGSPAATITTIAGNGIAGFSGDGGPATSASLWYPRLGAVDTNGNLFIADAFNYRIRKVASNGIITTIAGNGIQAFSGDGGLAINASFAGPEDVAVDAVGNLYIADYTNNRIRKIATNGIITTVAGSSGFSGFGGDGGPATSAVLAGPAAVAVDANGNLFIADYGNARIRKVSTSGIITTVAGNGVFGFGGDGGPATSARLNLPWDIVVDASGNLFIADYGNNRIRKVSTSGIITTVAGNGVAGFGGDGGPATSASLSSPGGVALDASGNLYIADGGNNRVRKVSTSGIITTIAGNGTYGFSGDGGPPTSASFAFPFKVVIDGVGNLYIDDFYNQRIRKVTGL